jgi:hypothetical protein
MNEAEDREGREDEGARKLAAPVETFIQRLYRDPRYLLVGKVERFGRELIAFVEGCTILSATGDVKGQALISNEYCFGCRPDGERPYGHESLLDHYLSDRRDEEMSLDDEELAALRDESWQYYVRRNFAFLLGRFAQARDDAEHNLDISNVIEQSSASDAAKWSMAKWWPWIERDRAVAQALWHLQHGETEQAATELYRAQRSIDQFGERHAEEYAREEEGGDALCAQMRQHVETLVDLLREQKQIPVSLEEQLDDAAARGDAEQVERLRAEMIRRAVGEDE